MSLEISILSEAYPQASKFLAVKDKNCIGLFVLPENTTYKEIAEHYKLKESIILGGANYTFEKNVIWVDGFSHEYGGVPKDLADALIDIFRMNRKKKIHAQITVQNYKLKNPEAWAAFER